jgi:hypothetical protein
MEFKSFIRCQNLHLVDRIDQFKISNFVYDGREIIRSLYSSLQGQTFYGEYSELVVSLFVSVKIDGLGNFLEQLTLQILTAFERLKPC